MKYFKFTRKTKIKHETKYLHAKDLKAFKFDHKVKYIEIEIHDLMEVGFIKLINLMDLEIFLTSPSSGIFSIDLFETEEEAC